MIMIHAVTDAPKRRGRPREFDLDDALLRARAVFSAQGYHGTSINDLSERTGLTAGSLYKAFTDKRGVFLAVLDQYRRERGDALQHAISHAESGRDAVRRLVSFYIAYSHGEAGRQGCLVVNAAKELALFDAEIAVQVEASFREKEGLFARFIELGMSDGSIRKDLDVTATSRSLVCLVLGLRVFGKTGKREDELSGVADAALKLLD